MAAVRALLQRCDPALLASAADSDCGEAARGEAARMALYLTESRRVQKVLWRQLFVLYSMSSLVEELESAQQLSTQPCPPHPDGGARGTWKALKANSRAALEDSELLLKSLQDRIQQIHTRRQALAQLAQQLRTQTQQHRQLDQALLTTHNALRSCDQQLSRLRAESEAALTRLTDWQRLRDDLQGALSAKQKDMQVHLLTLGQAELSLELRPRPSALLPSNELKPLKLFVTWNQDDRFTLQVEEGASGLVQDCVSGQWAELGAALREVMRCYACEAELLSEIQALRSSFAIDWRPAARQLVYLKSASLVCHLEVGEGYPSGGRAHLLSVQRDGQPVDTGALKLPNSELTLTEWLVLLCSSTLL